MTSLTETIVSITDQAVTVGTSTLTITCASTTSVPKVHGPCSAMSVSGFRYYSPELGRWGSRDPIGEMGGVNVYCFAWNAPQQVMDLLGMEPKVLKPGEFIDVPGCPCDKEDVHNKLVNKSKDALKAMLDNPVEYQIGTINGIPYMEDFYREYGGFICCDTETKAVTSTGPFPGTWRQQDGSLKDIPINATPTMENVVNSKKAQCPEGSYAAAFYHSHPSGTKFSPGDVDWSKGTKIPIGLIVPGMPNLKIGIPGTGTIEIPLLFTDDGTTTK